MLLDYPVFKILSPNDTGAAPGHQGGMVIPKDLEEYMPELKGTPSPAQPTLDQSIQADLYLDGNYQGTVSTRYQFQTWGGGRSPERRLTGNLGPIRDYAKGDDFLLIERSLEDPLYYRLSIETRGSVLYADLLKLAGTRRWGPLNTLLRPAENAAIASALAELTEDEKMAPVLISSDRSTSLSLVARKVRDQAFRRRLVEIYGGGCAVSGRNLVRPSGASGLDAAHVIPVEAGGTDDPRNGLLLSKDVHWAFDAGLVIINRDRKVEIPGVVRAIPANDFLRSLHGRELMDPNPVELRVAVEALDWHRKATMEKLTAGVT